MEGGQVPENAVGAGTQDLILSQPQSSLPLPALGPRGSREPEGVCSCAFCPPNIQAPRPSSQMARRNAKSWLVPLYWVKQGDKFPFPCLALTLPGTQ